MSDAQIVSMSQRIVYPEADGKPMAETDVHRDVMTDLIGTLKEHFRGAPDVYVSGNLLLYYEEGNLTAAVAPDVLVVKGVRRADAEPISFGKKAERRTS